MTWPGPSARTGALLHLGAGLPLVALWVWFGLIDRPQFPLDSRCSSCGVENYVVVLHGLAAAALAAVVACLAAARRGLRDDRSAPDRRTLAWLTVVALFVALSLVWSPPFEKLTIAATLASLLSFPVVGVWWLLTVLTWWARPPAGPEALERRLNRTLVAAWAALVLLLPATFGWVWIDRVGLFVF